MEQTGQIVRWSIFFGLFFLFLAYMAIGRWHANKRVRERKSMTKEKKC